MDRPNPINGLDVSGPIADKDKLSFVATHTIPVRHGMTIGEIALMLNKERNINANLKIIKMQNWRRAMWFDETGQTWINPSPNMRNLTQATLYPGIGLLETTNLSVGRGTDAPFEIIGSPWVDGRVLAKYLNSKKINGVIFVPVQFTPSSSKFKGEKCFGINIIITNREEFNPIKTGITIALALRYMYPKSWKMKNYNRLLVNEITFQNIKTQKSYKQIKSLWKDGLESLMLIRRKFLLYK